MIGFKKLGAVALGLASLTFLPGCPAGNCEGAGCTAAEAHVTAVWGVPVVCGTAEATKTWRTAGPRWWGGGP